MFKLEGRWVYSPQDLVSRLECEHRVELEKARVEGLIELPPSEAPVMLQLAADHGLWHEARMWESLKSDHKNDWLEIPKPDARSRASLTAGAEATLAAMRAGVGVIYQGVMFDGSFLGYPDFLERKDFDNDTNQWRYEPLDAKLSRTAKPAAVLQLAAYANYLEQIGMPRPKQIHLLLGDAKTADGKTQSLLLDDVSPVFEHRREVLLAQMGSPIRLPEPTWGDARPACGRCSWADHCESGREASRDLSLVAAIRGDQRRKLMDAGIDTIESLASSRDEDRPQLMAQATFMTLRGQAALQVRQDATRTDEDPNGEVFHEVLDPAPLANLPASSPGDVYFDIEGDPFANNGRGLEYLLGVVVPEDQPPRLHPWWAHDLRQEKEQFIAFMTWLQERRQSWPDMHVYHYAPYEVTAVKRLASQYGVMEDAVDDLLRASVFVDLYHVVRRSIRVSQRSYSLKKLEPLYMAVGRGEGVSKADDSVAEYERYIQLVAEGNVIGADAVLSQIAAYNEYDCISTLELDRWLRKLVADADLQGLDDDSELPDAHTTDDDDEQETDEVSGRGAVPEVAERLLAHVSDEPDDRNSEQQAWALMAAATGYHWREEKPVWWEHFERLRQAPEDLRDDTGVVVVDGGGAGEWERGPRGGRSKRDVRLEHDVETVHRFAAGDPVFLLYLNDVPQGLPTGDSASGGWSEGVVLEVESSAITVREGPLPAEAAEYSNIPNVIAPGRPPPIDVLVQAVLSCAEAMASTLPELPRSAIADILARRPPRVSGGLSRSDEVVSSVVDSLLRLDNSYIAVQGPPGTGKTHLGAHVVKQLVESGWRVGVVAQSHKVVENLLGKALEAGLPSNLVGKKPGKKSDTSRWAKKDVPKWIESQPEGFLVGGTAWTFAGNKFNAATHLDLLVIDEAGQFALGNTVAVSIAADRLLLLGDPQQLPQVSQGIHPEPIDRSALGWLIGEHEVMPAEFGYFLDKSYRLHPDVCDVISRLAYQGELRADPSTLERRLLGHGSGVHPVSVDHHGRSVHSPEEIEEVVALAQRLVGAEWVDGDAAPRPLGGSDILVVTPYNLQVSEITKALRRCGLDEVPVGTVDKFQGQEAPIVIVSMTSSAAQDIPRGLEFLMSRNRLNVAVSRAQWASYVVHSPVLVDTECRSVGQMQLLGGFLRVVRR